MSTRSWIKSVIPPIALPIVRRLANRGRYGFAGDYTTGDEAMARSTGYDAPNILEHVHEAARKVNSGEAVYERDMVLFGKIQYLWPLLAGLMRVADNHDGILGLLDTGDTLGTSRISIPLRTCEDISKITHWS